MGMAQLGMMFIGAVLAASNTPSTGGIGMRPGITLSLDGTWMLAPDPGNVGRDKSWWEKPQDGAKPTPVPWIMQEIFPGYHGVAWYWRDFIPPANPDPSGRYLLRFWQVDYLADVWVNGVHVGAHEGGEDPFVLDVTAAVKPGQSSRVAVRVLNPTNEPIDGIALAQTPRRNKTYPYSPGSDFNYGGITDSVELLTAPAVRDEDLYVKPDPTTGIVHVKVNLRNAGRTQARAKMQFAVSPAASGETLDAVTIERDLPPGDTLVEAEVRVAQPHLWQLNDPFLYRVTARVQADEARSFDEQSTRCGFRDFRFTDGYFRLNGRRIYLKSSHSGADTPVGVRVPYDKDLLRRDILNCKVMGFNMIRFIAGIPQRYQLDLCDEVGLLVYEENFASWCLGESPQMGERFDHSTAAMVRRDRNHPSIVMWGMLNETSGNTVFFRAVRDLSLVRDLDPGRVVMLNSGGFDGYAGGSEAPGPPQWRPEDGMVPNVTRNERDTARYLDGTTWPPHTFALHPGISKEYSVVRWTAPGAGEYSIAATFANIVTQGKARTDIHVFHNGRAIFESFINLKGKGEREPFAASLTVKKGDTLDCVVGVGDDWPYGDTTGLDLVIKGPGGTTYDVMRDFGTDRNPNGVWTYGWLKPGKTPDLSTFSLYPVGEAETRKVIGRLSNPGSREWEDVLSDQHPYQALPHGATVINTLRTVGGGQHHLWLSEYGIGSAIDLTRLARHYEQLGKTGCEDAVAYRHFLDQFLADWKRWHMEDTFASPEDYFNQCLKWHAALRLLGTNAIRANPNLVGFSMTGTHDQGLTGEGATASTFRDLKPGVTDALFDAWYPLRWCLFVEPVQAYRGRSVKLEAVLANEDVLSPGAYPVRFQVVRPDGTRLYDKTVNVTIPDPHSKPEPPFAIPMFSLDLPVDGPSGRYRFLAAFERGGAAAGGDVEFYVADEAEMPKVGAEVVLWGDDPELGAWLARNGIRTRPFAAGQQSSREVILFGSKAPQDLAAWQDLAQHIARGSTAVFLCPEVFRRGDNPVGWVPLRGKGSLADMPVWVYHKDDWAKRHPTFDGLPAGGILDHTFFREIFPTRAWSGQDDPAEVVAGSINTSSGYSSGLTVAVHTLGAGRFVLNTLNIRGKLGEDPVAERLVRNMLNYAARGSDQPSAALPADFPDTLRAIGYN
jgi:hypothetical protein